MFINWVLSLQSWIVAGWMTPLAVYAFIDALSAAIFFQMSRGRWFPVPLFIMHALLVMHHLCAIFLPDHSAYWVQIILNRALDLELFYIMSCGMFRIIMLRRMKTA